MSTSAKVSISVWSIYRHLFTAHPNRSMKIANFCVDLYCCRQLQQWLSTACPCKLYCQSEKWNAIFYLLEADPNIRKINVPNQIHTIQRLINAQYELCIIDLHIYSFASICLMAFLRAQIKTAKGFLTCAVAQSQYQLTLSLPYLEFSRCDISCRCRLISLLFKSLARCPADLPTAQLTIYIYAHVAASLARLTHR